MDQDKAITALSLFLGSIMAATGFTIAGISSFAEKPLLVFVGFSVFAAGYKVSWYGTKKFESQKDILEAFLKVRSFYTHLKTNFTNYTMILVGLALCSYGTTMFAQLVFSFSFGGAIISGIVCVSGYIIAHEGVNEVLI